MKDLKMARRTGIDWQRIEREYRLGTLTIQEIAANNGVAYSGVRRKAKLEGWTRDLAHTVMIATKRALIEDAKSRAEQLGADVGAELGGKSAHAMEVALKMQVAENVVTVRRHLEKAAASQTLVDLMKHELFIQTADLDAHIKLAELLDDSGPDERGSWKHDKLNEIYRRAISLSNRADTLKKLVETESKIKDTQRQALRLDAEAGNERPPIETVIDNVKRKLELMRVSGPAFTGNTITSE
ncbi:MAG: hypothetical protein KKC79_01205 [Gammaproteobacteria bacterium]|nr:hypothetical protein [Gammaproteobacteria bacterium]MBU1441456.1 hypothetical protein [Gammaproteobacteria bacterium]MBU2287130.1 hypothetical protein [Gammaproteobacteria bacterium]MBU2407248.1 hypothetical protein [Gammaproteobacteria bacterium]